MTRLNIKAKHETYLISFSGSTVGELKQDLSRSQIAEQNTSIYWAGKRLRNEDSLQDLGIGQDAELALYKDEVTTKSTPPTPSRRNSSASSFSGIIILLFSNTYYIVRVLAPVAIYKIIVLGNSGSVSVIVLADVVVGVGKTSIIQRFVNNFFSEEYCPITRGYFN